VKFIKPQVIISKCLEFDACRYDGKMISNDFISKLKKYVDFIPVCPEVEIELGIPRDTIQIERSSDSLFLVQPETGLEFSDRMNTFSKSYLSKILHVDGFLLKYGSPSCGVSSAKIYPKGSKIPLGKGPGLFTSKVKKYFPMHPIEEEKRLNNLIIREHFLVSIFVLADYRCVNSFDSLYKYHAKHKYLFMAYNQDLMREMGKIGANDNNLSIDDVIKLYYNLLLKVFSKRVRYQSNVNTLQHIMGYFKNDVSNSEKKHFLELIDLYFQKKVTLVSINNLLFSWVLRFDNKYLKGQSFFNPYPRSLIEAEDNRFL
jgi:uncharacterized protein YbgA (DUF1722 family)/uncharacterized protein YbbK (DUF523 family)